MFITKSNSFSASNPTVATTITLEFLKSLSLPEYSEEANKADYGKLLIVAGSRRLPGGAILAARAALRSGVGTVRVAAPESVATAIGVAVPEAMVIPLPETNDGTLSRKASTPLAKQFEPCDAAVIGPGLDENDETAGLLKSLALECPLPAVLDASALLALAGSSAWEWKTTAARILTPHQSEFETLLGTSLEELKASREEIALKFARMQKAVLVLKGRETLIADQNMADHNTADQSGALYRNTAGTRGLGTAGSGDVLAGIIGGLLAQMTTQNLDPTRAAVWGVHLHALAGEAAEKDLGDDGLTASDLISRLPGVFRYARKQTASRSDGERTGLRRM